jgi:hypothetical protein
MRRKSREPRPSGWAIHSAFVPRRDGPRRLEQALQVLLDADPGAGGIPPTPKQEIEHESRRLCQGLDREAGA